MPDRRRGERGTHAQRNARRALIRKLRKPLIGLSLIGAGLPATSVLVEDRSTASEPAPSPDTGEDLEERLTRRIALNMEMAARNVAVANAVERFDITRDMAADIYDTAHEAGIEADVAYGLVNTESTFRERSVSPVGARGLTQVMPRTAAWLRPGTTASDLFDRRTNLRLGFQYLSRLINRYRGDLKLALLAYNRGPGTVDRALDRGQDPDNGYADKVLGD